MMLRLLVLFTIIVFLSSVAKVGYAFETGFLKVKRKYSYLYRPFVKVSNYKDKIVFFIDAHGKIYRGFCYKRFRHKKYCRITTRNYFKTDTQKFSYMVLKINHYDAPSLIKFGKIDIFNIIGINR